MVPLTHYSYIPYLESVPKIVKDKSSAAFLRDHTSRLVCVQTASNVFQPAAYKDTMATLDLYEKHAIRVGPKHTLNQLATFMKGKEDPDIDDCLLPAIVFVLSRKQVERYAEEISASLWPFDAKEPYTIAHECEQMIRKFPNWREYVELPEYQTLVRNLEKGVATHHSGMIPVLREIVEIMISKKCVKMLFATESFAIGLDCPIRTAIFISLQKYTQKGLRYLHAHEYTQMAGRAGRRGIDTVGHIIHLNNIRMR
jgi:antiviral helicase SKI2